MAGMQLLRRPLFWMVTLEAIIVMILLGAAWHFFESYRRGAPAATAASRPASGAMPGARPPARLPPPSPSRPVPSATVPRAAGLPVDVKHLNSDAASWERLEERMATALTGALRTYIETVVLPAVERAERVSPATSAATTQSPAAIRKTP